MGKKSYSGRFLLRIDPELHSRLVREAAAQMVSLNELCRVRLAEVGAGGDRPDERWVDEVRRAFPVGPIAVVLFGSEARLRATSGSDVDLLVVFPPGTKIARSMYRALDAIGSEPPAGRETSHHLVSLPESPEAAGGLWYEVALEGRMLHDADGRTSRFLARLRDEIASGRMRRARSHGHPYWIREESHS